jgi:hypothetical protein
MAFQAAPGVHLPISSRSTKFRHLSFPFDSLRRRCANSGCILFDFVEEFLGIALASKLLRVVSVKHIARRSYCVTC